MANYHGDNHGNAGLLYGSSSFSGPTNIGGTHNETHHHYLEGGPERPKPKPFSVIPFKENPNFISRTDIFEQIDARRSEENTRIALVGIGGAGKTQLAIQYAYQVRKSKPSVWVFWIHANSEAKFTQSCTDIARRLGLINENDNTTRIIEKLRDWLSYDDSGDWLMVVDNVDNLNLSDDHQLGLDDGNSPLSVSAKSMEGLFHLPKGCIIFTSRSEGIAIRLIGNLNSLVKIGPMKEDEGLALTRRYLGDRNNKEDVISLLETLDYIPLAITQAAIYIEHLWPHVSVHEYLEMFQTNDQTKADLLQQDQGDTFRSRSGHESNSVLITLRMTFDQIQRERPSAADLLSLMCFFNPQSIPEFVLQKSPQWSTNSDQDYNLEYLNDIKTLRGYSLISEQTDGSSFSMHRLVRLSVNIWLKSHDRLETWKHEFWSVLHDSLPDCLLSNWRTFALLFPHIEEAATEPAMQMERRVANKLRILLDDGSWYARLDGRYERAEMMARRSTRITEAVYGEDDIKTLQTLEELASTLFRQYKYPEAEAVQRRVLKGMQAALGTNHFKVLSANCLLIKVLEEENKINEASDMARQVMPGLEKLLRDGSLNTQWTWNLEQDLTEVYECLKMWDELENLNRLALAREKEASGTNTLRTADCILNLAVTLKDQEKYNEAESLFLEVLTLRTELLGKDNIKTLEIRRRLASVYRSSGKFQLAASYYKQTLDGYNNMLEPDHPTMQKCAKHYDFCLSKLKELQLDKDQEQNRVNSRPKTRQRSRK